MKIYSGGFEMGEYSGTGTLYENGVRVYSGEVRKEPLQRQRPLRK
ncbi:MAG: hypothetical protein ACLSG5_05540 [Oscillospiraceae bacterium]